VAIPTLEFRLKWAIRNRATLAMARKLVAYLMAVDKAGNRFRFGHWSGSRAKMSSQWVSVAGIKGSVDIEPALAHYGVPLKRVRRTIPWRLSTADARLPTEPR
jgi:hypothetical protein